MKNLNILAILILSLSSFASCSKKVSSPNIILILADDLGWSDLGCYGSEVSTPNLDFLAQKGMRFTQFYNTAKCFPSRACLLTGLYAQECGYDKTHLNPIVNAVTLGEVLQSTGYSTYWSGKHHGLENPIDRGFDHYYGLRDGACNHFNPGLQRKGEGKPAQKRNNRAWCIDSLLFQPYTPEEMDFYTTDYFSNYGLKFLEDAKKQEKPFFLYLAYTAPHDPLMAWSEDIEKYKGKYDEGYEIIRQKRFMKQQSLGLLNSKYQLPQRMHHNWDSLTTEEQIFEAQKMEVYAAMIDRLDQNIGRVLEQLKMLELEDNTLILFMSDNGASAEVVNLETDNDEAAIGSLERWISLGADWANVSNTPFNYYKNYSYEGGINTPFIAYWPERITANTITHFPGHFIDLMPTLIELSTATYPDSMNQQMIKPLSGQSLVPIFENTTINNRESTLFWQWRAGQAMREDNWKIVKHEADQAWDLYDLSVDPTEMENLAFKFPERVMEMDSLYQQWWQKCEIDKK